ncbi:hypothetical protein M569_14218, partial [Genlisea aurea]
SSPSSYPSSRLNNRATDDRIASVFDVVNDRKLPPEIRGQRNNVRSETDIVNVVERRVYRAMEEGQFENLAGKGKPLDLTSNPHADPAEDTLYRILNKNGCAPRCVELNKEIRNGISQWRQSLRKAFLHKHGGHDRSKWLNSSEKLQHQLRDLNRKILDYNLIVPFGRQMCGLKWEKEVNLVSEE